MSRQSNDGSSGIGRTALGLLALGLGSAMFGAIVVGPRLGQRLAQNPPAAAGASATPVSAGAPDGRAPAETHAPRSRATEPGADVRVAEAPRPAAESAARQSAPKDDGVKVDVRPSDDQPTSVEPPPSGGGDEADGGQLVDEKASRPKARTAKPDDTAEGADRKRSVSGARAPATETERPRTASRAAAETRPAPPAHPSGEKREERGGGKKYAAVNSEEAGTSVRDRAGHSIAVDEPEKEDAHVYMVQLGRFKSREAARKLRGEIEESTGSKGFLVSTPAGFRVQMGVFRLKANAEKIADDLRAHNFQPEVTEGKRAVPKPGPEPAGERQE